MMRLLYLLHLVSILSALPGNAAPPEAIPLRQAALRRFEAVSSDKHWSLRMNNETKSESEISPPIPSASPRVQDSRESRVQNTLTCGGHPSLAPGEYVIQSPNYPYDYTNDFDCDYVITPASGNVVDFMCSAFSLENKFDCPFDYLEVENQRYCGEQKPERRMGLSSLNIHFHTDESEVSTGFSCTISVHSSSSSGGNAACRCGAVNRASRIVGGQETEVHEYPWQVALIGKVIRHDGYVKYYPQSCGGAIVNSFYILTAAHCMKNHTSGILYTPDDVNVLVGRHDVSTFETWEEVERIIRHPNYVSAEHGYDVALLRLKRAIEFPTDNTVAPVCLPADASNDYVGVEATIAGWGRTTDGGKSSPVLLEVTLPVLSDAKCMHMYRYVTNIEWSPSMLCAADEHGEKDSCQGDSGGPLVVPESDGSFSVIGITSTGMACADPSYPGIYARVTHVLDWINEHIADGMFCPRSRSMQKPR